jgi:C-terminal processing protease CtpA/Prc
MITSTLINSKSISYAESVIETLKRNLIGVTIGDTTIGCNGDVAMFKLPVFSFIMTVTKDFSGYHASGISPDIKTIYNLEAIRKQQDKEIETALNYLYDLETNNRK